jgi:hypothetical protein
MCDYSFEGTCKSDDVPSPFSIGPGGAQCVTGTCLLVRRYSITRMVRIATKTLQLSVIQLDVTDNVSIAEASNTVFSACFEPL